MKKVRGDHQATRRPIVTTLDSAGQEGILGCILLSANAQNNLIEACPNNGEACAVAGTDGRDGTIRTFAHDALPFARVRALVYSASGLISRPYGRGNCSTKKVRCHPPSRPLATPVVRHSTHNGGRSPASAAHKAAKGPLNPDFGAEILEHLHLRAATRSIAAFLASNTHFDPATPCLQPPRPGARALRSHHWLACPDFLFENPQTREEYIKIRR